MPHDAVTNLWGGSRVMTNLPLEYLRRGLSIVPIPRGQKKPAMPGWQNFSAAIEDVPRLFGNGENDE